MSVIYLKNVLIYKILNKNIYIIYSETFNLGENQMSNFIKVAIISDLKPGENKVVEVNGEQVALFNVDGEFFAINNTCLHRGGPLGEGFLDGDIVTCPLHGWRYNVKTGANLMIPNQKVAAYQVRVEGNDILVSLE